jgi:predicted metal-dependent HD superfamily phosphohydrolase
MTPYQFIGSVETREKIIQHMTEPHRVYHNLNHAIEVAWLGYGSRGLLDSNIKDLLFHYFASFYHDIIYVPGNKDNEQKSANMFVDDMMLLGYKEMNKEDFSDVYTAIIQSADHFNSKHYSTDRVGRFLDYDIWGLGSEPEQYVINSQKLRLEFTDVSDEDWRKGRMEWIDKALDAPSIYRQHTDREKTASANLRREFNYLKDNYLKGYHITKE